MIIYTYYIIHFNYAILTDELSISIILQLKLSSCTQYTFVYTIIRYIDIAIQTILVGLTPNTRHPLFVALG